MRKSIALAAVAAALLLSGCASASGLADLTSHLNERGCATKGSAHASAGITGASLAGDVSWDCGRSAEPPL